MASIFSFSLLLFSFAFGAVSRRTRSPIILMSTLPAIDSGSPVASSVRRWMKRLSAWSTRLDMFAYLYWDWSAMI